MPALVHRGAHEVVHPAVDAHRAGERPSNASRRAAPRGPLRWTDSPFHEVTRRALGLQLANAETLGAVLAAGLEVVLKGATVERGTGDGRALADWLGLRGA